MALLISANLFAQDWVEGMQDHSVNFYEVQEKFDAYWKKMEKKAAKTNENFRPGKSSFGHGWAQYKRWEDFWQVRTYPTGDRPNPEILWQETQAKSNKTLAANAGDWEAIGPMSAPSSNSYSGIGRVNCVEFHPTNNNIIWIGTPAGGLWKSVDGGTSWSTNTDLLQNLGVSDIAIDPLHPDTMFIATGDRDGGDTYSFGILKSVDGGQTWNPTGMTNSVQQLRRIGGIHIVPTNTQIIIAATRNGIFRSTDGGATFNGIQSGQFNMLAPDPSNPNKLFAGTINSPTRIWVSKDFGASWTMLTQGLPVTGIARVEIAVSAQDSNYVYALYSNNSNGFEGIYRSTNGGNTWIQRASSPNLLGWSVSGNDNGGQGWYDLSLAVSPTNKNQLFVGGVNLWRSNNGGTGWLCVGHWYGAGGTPTVHADIHNFGWHPSTNNLFICTDGGLYRTANQGSSYIEMKSGLNITQYYKISQSTSNSTLFLGGAQDNGTHRQVGTNWAQVNGGDGMDNAIDPDNDNIMFASSQNGNFRRSTNGGNNFSSMNLPPNGSGNWVTPMLIDPSNANIVYIGFDKIWKSTNKGSSWQATSSQTVGNGNIDVFAVSKSNNQIIYVGIDDDVFLSSNGGSTWSQISFNLVGSSSVTGIAISPTDPNHIWVTRSGYASNHKVFESKNAGTTWINITGSLPNLPVNCVIYEEGSLDGVYIGTDVGVYYKDGTMSDWKPYMLGLPNVIVRDLEIFYPTKKLRAGTYGRGIWEASLISKFLGVPEADFSISPASVCNVTDTISLFDESDLGPDQFKWSFYPNTVTYVNGTSDSSQNPQVIFNAKGEYSVTLNASNSYGSDAITKAKAIFVGGIPLPFVETFEDARNISQWTIENPDNDITWLTSLVSGSSPGNQAMMLDFYNYNSVGAKDGLITPPLNFTGFSNINLTFDHAYIKYNAAKNDSLKVYISTDCGTTWTLLQAYGEDGTTNWVTGSNNTGQFIPSSSADWCGSSGNATCKTISLNTFAGNDDVRIKFETVNAYGNNLFIDNVNITGTPNVKPVANFIGDTTGCTIGTFSFHDVSLSNATTWNWSFPGGTPSTSTSANPTVSYTTGGTYNVTLIASNAAGADTITKTAYISIDQAVMPTVTISSSSTSLCANEQLTLTAVTTNEGANPDYWWFRNNVFETKGTSTYTTSANNGDVFTCVLISSLQCVITDSVASNNVQINIIPIPNVTLNSFPSMCVGDSPIVLTGGSPAGGVYSGNGVVNGVFDPALTGVGGQIITYTYVGANGCQNSDQKNISVNNGPPKPTVTYTNFVLKADPISTSYTYQWYDPQGNAIPNATDTVYIPYVLGDYTVKLTFINGCESISDPYTVNQVGLDEELLNRGIKIYPNPVSTTLQAEILMKHAGTVTVNIVDVTGRLVYADQLKLDVGTQNLRINTSNLANGAYILQLIDNEANKVQQRFIKN